VYTRQFESYLAPWLCPCGDSSVAPNTLVDLIGIFATFSEDALNPSLPIHRGLGSGVRNMANPPGSQSRLAA